MFSEAQIQHIRSIKLIIMDKMDNLKSEKYISSCPGNVTDYMFLSGGAIASLIQGEEPKDWDLYFKHPTPMAQLTAHLNSFIDDIADVDEKYREAYGLNGKMITNKATTMKNGFSFITMQHGSVESIKSTFDYLHTTSHYDLLENKLYISPAQYDASINKKLIVNSFKNVQQWRTKKFISRGYTNAD